MLTFELNTDDLFDERSRQFIRASGLPAQLVSRVRTRVNDPWSERPGGWTTEWAVEAEAAETHGDWLLAALCRGAAKFPCIATEDRAEAYRRQLVAYERSAPTFPVTFERRVLDIGDTRPTNCAHLSTTSPRCRRREIH